MSTPLQKLHDTYGFTDFEVCTTGPHKIFPSTYQRARTGAGEPSLNGARQIVANLNAIVPKKHRAGGYKGKVPAITLDTLFGERPDAATAGEAA